MSDKLLQALMHRGMSEKEAKIYLTILELGSAAASVVARRSGVKRVTTYGILHDMMTNKLASSVDRNGVTYFQVIEPAKLLEKKRQDCIVFEKIVPELAGLSNMYDNKPRIKYYEGIGGLKELYMSLLEHQHPLYAFLSDDDIDPALQQYLNDEFIPLRNKLGTTVQVIVNDTEENADYLEKINSSKLHEVKLSSHNLDGIRGETILFGEDKVAFALYAPDEMVGYTIQNKQLYTTMKTMFDFIWDSL